MLSRTNIALITPGKSKRQETFINAHIDYINANLFVYYGGATNLQLDEEGVIIPFWMKGILRIFGKKFLHKNLYDAEFAIKRSFSKNKIQFVIFEYGTTCAEYIDLIKKLNIPFMVNFFGFDINSKLVIQKYMNKYKEAFQLATFVTGVSREMIGKLEKYGCPKSKLVYNPCAPNDGFHTVQPKYNSCQFFALGRFVNKKSPIELIMAFYFAHKLNPSISLVIGGDGPLLEASKALVKSLGLEHCIDFKGKVKQEDYVHFLESSIAFVQHSVVAENGDSEGTPVAILEASLAGLPIVSTKHAGIPEVVIENKTGFLVDEHDVEAMANFLNTLSQNHALAQKLGTRGKQFVKENYSMEKHISIIEGLIQKALESQ